MGKTIVFSGHGDWPLKDDEFVQLPRKCTMKFYTMNMKTLSDGLGGDIDRGLVSGLEPSQVAAPFTNIPNMRLYPPHGLTIKSPDSVNWRILTLPTAIPVDNKNLQIKIANRYGGGANLSTLFELLEDVIHETKEDITFLWAACRAINLQDTGGEKIGVNAMER